jgi:hypothetical protein
VSGQLHAPAVLLPRKEPGRHGEVEIIDLAGTRTTAPFNQLVTSHYTDWAIPAQYSNITYLYLTERKYPDVTESCMMNSLIFLFQQLLRWSKQRSEKKSKISILKIEAATFSPRHILEDNSFHFNRTHNLKPQDVQHNSSIISQQWTMFNIISV